MDKRKCQKTSNHNKMLPNQLKNVKWDKSTQEDLSKSCQSKLNELPVETNELCENNLVKSLNPVNLAAPDILSALQLANEIQAVSSEKKSFHGVKTDSLNMRKGLKKANIPFTKQVYKNLVELEVNDDELISGKGIPSKRSNFCKNVDDSFQLLEHFKPDFSTQFFTEPEIEEIEHTQIEYYNGLDIYNLLESLPDVI